MRQVCKDWDGRLTWFFEPDERTYKRLDRTGQPHGVLAGEYLPNPYTLWESRLKNAGLTHAAPEAAFFRPTDTTFKLWEDWQKVIACLH